MLGQSDGGGLSDRLWSELKPLAAMGLVDLQRPSGEAKDRTPVARVHIHIEDHDTGQSFVRQRSLRVLKWVLRNPHRVWMQRHAQDLLSILLAVPSPGLVITLPPADEAAPRDGAAMGVFADLLHDSGDAEKGKTPDQVVLEDVHSFLRAAGDADNHLCDFVLTVRSAFGTPEFHCKWPQALKDLWAAGGVDVAPGNLLCMLHVLCGQEGKQALGILRPPKPMESHPEPYVYPLGLE